MKFYCKKSTVKVDIELIIIKNVLFKPTFCIKLVSFVTECGLIGRKGSGPMGMLLDSSR